MRAGKIIAALSSFFLISVPVITWTQPPVWKKIKPVESSLADVEKVFGTSIERSHYVRYEAKEGVYFFSFSDGVCVTKWKEERNSEMGGLPPLKEGTPLSDWNVPEWSIEKVSYLPNEWIPTASLGLSLAKLKKINKSPHTPDIFDYMDEKEGISYQVQYEYKRIDGRVRKSSMVTSVTLFPVAIYSNRRCG